MRRRAKQGSGDGRPAGLAVGVLVLVLVGAKPLAAQQIIVGPPPGISVVPGGVVEVPVEVDLTAAAGENIASIQFELSWDPALLTYLGSSSPDLPGGWTCIPNETQVASGVLGLACFSSTGTAASFVILRIGFEAANVAEPTNAALDIAVTAAGNEVGTDLLSIITARSGFLCIGIVGILGDVTDDGVVNIIDAQQCARHSIGLDTPNAPRMDDVGDVNEDGVINIIDCQQIARYAVGLDTPSAPNIGQPLPGCSTASRVIFAASGSGSSYPPSDLYRVEASASGTDELVGRISTETGFQPVITDLAVAPDGSLWGVSFSALYRLSKASGLASERGSLGLYGSNALAFDNSGYLYGATSSGQFITIDTITGAAQVLGEYGSNFESWGDMAFSPSGTLFATVRDPMTGAGFLVIVDPSTGQAAPVNAGVPTVHENIWGLAFVGSELYGLTTVLGSETGQLLIMDTQAGTGVYLRDLSFDAFGAGGASTDRKRGH